MDKSGSQCKKQPEKKINLTLFETEQSSVAYRSTYILRHKIKSLSNWRYQIDNLGKIYDHNYVFNIIFVKAQDDTLLKCTQHTYGLYFNIFVITLE